MIRFKEFTEQNKTVFEEGAMRFLKKVYTTIKNKIKAIIGKLGFGQKKTINIGSVFKSQLNEAESFDLKSRMGYLSEYICAYELAKLIDSKMGLLKEGTDVNNLKLFSENYINTTKTEVDLQKNAKLIKDFNKELSRMKIAGVKLAESIFNDIKVSDDLQLLEFDIILTGDSLKGQSKADIVLEVRKKGKKEILDSINASLKAYKTPSINLANTTYISFFKSIFYDNLGRMGTDDFIEKFITDYGDSSDLSELKKIQGMIPVLMKQDNISKSDARKLAKGKIPDVIGIIVNIFNLNYKQNKDEINLRMLKLLGFDDVEEDFYAVIGTSNKNMKILSSRQSKEFNDFLEKFKQGFNLKIERNKETMNAYMIFLAPDKTEIIRGNLTFADTGGKSAQGKINFFVNFKQFLS